MVAMSLVRRRQLIIRGVEDPYAHKLPPLSRNASSPGGVGVNSHQTTLSECTDAFCLIVALVAGSSSFLKAIGATLKYSFTVLWEQDRHGIRTGQRTTGLE